MPEDVLSIAADNINELNKQQANIDERRFSHIKDIAALLVSDIEDEGMFFFDDVFRSRYKQFRESGCFAPGDDILPASRNSIANAFYSYDMLQQIYLCRCLLNILSERSSCEITPEMLMRDDTPRSNTPMPNRIAYLRNAYADIAYSKFAKILFEPTVTYCNDFNGVCEDTYYGRAALCILPVENNVEGRLVSFRNLINKYDLKIVLLCTVNTFDGNYARFALLKKNIEQIRCRPEYMGQSFFEFNVIFGSTADIEGVFAAARCCGLKLNRIDSMPLTYSDKEYSYNLLFNTDNADINTFLCYLSVVVPQFTPVGLYSHITVE